MGSSYTERVETTSDLCASAQRAICEGRKSVFVTQKIDSDQNQILDNTTKHTPDKINRFNRYLVSFVWRLEAQAERNQAFSFSRYHSGDSTLGTKIDNESSLSDNKWFQ